MPVNKLEVPNESMGDKAHALVKAGLSAVPVIGGPAVELFQYVIQPPLEKRREEWMSQVGEKLLELESQGLKLESLQTNDEFISAVMYASQMALRTHQTEKLAALRNAILNIAKGQAPEEALQHISLNFVDSLTELHLRILRVFQAPFPPSGMSVGSLGDVIESNIPELRDRRDLYGLLWRDLYASSLVDTENLNVTMSGNGLSQKRTTGFGDSFLAFISESQ